MVSALRIYGDVGTKPGVFNLIHKVPAGFYSSQIDGTCVVWRSRCTDQASGIRCGSCLAGMKACRSKSQSAALGYGHSPKKVKEKKFVKLITLTIMSSCDTT